MGREPTNCGQLKKENYQTDEEQREALAQARANSLILIRGWGAGKRVRQSRSWCR